MQCFLTRFIHELKCCMPDPFYWKRKKPNVLKNFVVKKTLMVTDKYFKKSKTF
jgi:hypothetical protein